MREGRAASIDSLWNLSLGRDLEDMLGRESGANVMARLAAAFPDGDWC
jgi:hypothetical protein